MTQESLRAFRKIPRLRRQKIIYFRLLNIVKRTGGAAMKMGVFAAIGNGICCGLASRGGKPRLTFVWTAESRFGNG
jgi:hypothetical protein